MNEKDAKKAIRAIAKQVLSNGTPDKQAMDALTEAGYLLERKEIHGMDGMLATFPNGVKHYATWTRTSDGRKDTATVYTLEDVSLYGECNQMLANANNAGMLYDIDAKADGIKATGLRNQIRTACMQLKKMMHDEDTVLPEAALGQDDETPLECYEGFNPEPAKPEPVENTLEWLKRAHEGITVSRKNERACWWVSGNTKPMKEKLKAMGFKWAPKKKMWYLKPQTA